MRLFLIPLILLAILSSTTSAAEVVPQTNSDAGRKAFDDLADFYKSDHPTALPGMAAVTTLSTPPCPDRGNGL